MIQEGLEILLKSRDIHRFPCKFLHHWQQNYRDQKKNKRKTLFSFFIYIFLWSIGHTIVQLCVQRIQKYLPPKFSFSWIIICKGKTNASPGSQVLSTKYQLWFGNDADVNLRMLGLFSWNWFVFRSFLRLYTHLLIFPSTHPENTEWHEKRCDELNIPHVLMEGKGHLAPKNWASLIS